MNFALTLDLVNSIRRGDVAAVKDILTRNGNVPLNCNSVLLVEMRTMRPLGLAASLGDCAMVEMLLQCGAQVDGAAYNCSTPLHLAASHGHDNVMDILIAHGANVAALDLQGASVLCVAARLSNQRAVMRLLDCGAPLDDRMGVCAAAAVSVAVISTLIERGVDVSSLRDKDYATPLHSAVWTCSDADDKREVCAFLIDTVGVDVNAVDSKNRTPMHYAATHGRHELLRLLIEAHADVDCAMDRGCVPLMQACGVEHLQSVLILLAAGADVRAVDSGGQSAGDWAARTTIAKELLSLLVAADAGVDISGTLPATVLPTPDSVERAVRQIARQALELVRERALQVCLGLQSRQLDALQMCEILRHSCGPFATMVAFHHWWAIVTIAKHFQRQ